MKPRSTIAIWLLLLPVTAFAGDPGLVTVVGEQPVALDISVPSSSAYKLSYDPARVAVWDTVTKDNLIAPNAEFTAPAVKGDAEPDCDIDLGDFAGFQRCFGAGPLGPCCDVFDFEPDADVDLTDFASLQPTIAGPENCVPVTATVFVEGLTASTTLGDAAIDVLADPDGDTIFTLQSTEEVTVVTLTISPSSGLLGTPINIQIQPSIAPLAFSSSTTAEWTGAYAPQDTSTTGEFTVSYDATAVRETSASNAVLIFGDGEITMGDPGHPSFGGILNGEISVSFDDGIATKTFDFTAEPSFTYVQGYMGAGDEIADPPILGPIPVENQYVTLESSYSAQVLLTVLADSNSFTTAIAPAALAVELVSEDSLGVEIDRVVLTCYLEQDRGDDFGPDRLVYYSDWELPIIFVNHLVNDAEHPTLSVLEVDESGRVYPIVGTP